MSDSQDEKALNTAMWRGEVNARLTMVETHTKGMDAKQEAFQANTNHRMGQLELSVQSVATRVGIYAAIAAFFSSALGSIVIAMVLRK